jgi:ferric-chelate reductase
MYGAPQYLLGASLGGALLILAFAIYSFAWTLSVHPYYGTQTPGHGSPPLSVRAGWAALATTPFIYALATKKNPISVLTGISHEKLNIYHRCKFVVMCFINRGYRAI